MPDTTVRRTRLDCQHTGIILEARSLTCHGNVPAIVGAGSPLTHGEHVMPVLTHERLAGSHSSKLSRITPPTPPLTNMQDPDRHMQAGQ